MNDRISFALPTSRFAVSERRATLVGRAAEMRELDVALEEARDNGELRAVTVMGAAGIGKTRLVRDFLLRARGVDKMSARVFRGNARENGSTYEAFARALRARFGIVEGMDPEAAKAQVRAQVSAVLEDRKVGDVVYLLGQLLDLEFFDSPLLKAIEGDAQQLRAMRRAVIKGFIETDARRAEGTFILVLDDLQWGQDETLDLVTYLVENVKAPMLVICIARPELGARRDGWSRQGGAHHRVVTLAPLSETDGAAVMHDLLAPCGDDEAVEDLVDAACTLAGGNPALLEQMVRIYLDTGVLEATDDFDDEKWNIHIEKLETVRLPLTVEDAVQARIASLAREERDLLERASIMGGVFWLGGLLAIRRLEEPTPDVWASGDAPDLVRTREILKELRDRDYVLRLPDSTFAGDEEYVFKHNLERETLARLTPPAAARAYHQAIAEWLAFKEHVGTSEEYLTMLARHREKAGRGAQAATAYVAAADVARSQYANAKAAELYATALALLGASKEAGGSEAIGALHHYGDVLQALGRTEDAMRAFRDMLTRAFRLDLRAKGGAAHSRIGRLYRETGRLDRASAHLDAALALFQDAEDERGVASTLDDVGKLHWLRGDYPKALEFTEKALAMRRKLADRRSIALSLNNLGLVYQDSAQPLRALDAFEQALKIRREIGDLLGVSISLNNLGTVAQDQKDDLKALVLFTEALDVAKETGDRNRIALVLTNLGETYDRLGDADRAIGFLKQAEDIADELGDKVGLGEAVRALGKAYLAQREFTKARECTARAVAIFTEVESKVQLGVALRSLGDVTASGSAGGAGIREAAAHYKRSVTIFEEVGNEVELARSARAYAELVRTSDLAADSDAAVEGLAAGRRADEIFARLKLGNVEASPRSP
jgi:tetratricopeptide (TPR) repeat protein